MNSVELKLSFLDQYIKTISLNIDSRFKLIKKYFMYCNNEEIAILENKINIIVYDMLYVLKLSDYDNDTYDTDDIRLYVCAQLDELVNNYNVLYVPD